MKTLIQLLLLMLSCSALAAEQSEIEELKKRIESLEKQQEELLGSPQEPKTTVNSFFKNNLTLGGFLNTGYDFITGPDTDTQSANNNALGINLAAEFGNNYRFSSQFVNLLTVNMLNPHNDPNAEIAGLPETREFRSYSPLSVLTQGYIEYTANRKLILQGGLGYVPFGYVLSVREPVIYVRSGGPQLAKNNQVASSLWSGIHIQGSFQKKENTYGYNAYTFLPRTFTRHVGVGGRFWMSAYESKVISGISTQIGRDEHEVIETVGTDFRFYIHPIQLSAEFAQGISRKGDSWTAYIEPGYFIFEEEILLYVFGDYSYSPKNETRSGNITIPDPYQKWEYGFGMNWLPTSYTRIRIGITFGDYVGSRARLQGVDRDFTTLNISAGVAF